MAQEPDLSHSITMHPHPFHHHPNQPERLISSPHTPIPQNTSRDPGASTAFEAITPTAEQNDPIARHISSAPNDLEDQRPPRYTRENDPYQLSSAFKNDSEIRDIAANTSRKRDGCGPIKFNNDASKARKIQKFYENQNENIERMLKPVEAHKEEAKQEAGDDHLKFQIAVYGSFAANVVLAGLQLYGAVSSGSLSLFTTMADSVFDPLSNITLIVTNRAVKRVDPNRFPSGKARLETVGNIVFCFLMTAVSFILIAFSIRALVDGNEEETNSFHFPSVIAVTIAFATKLALFLYCWALKDKYSQIKILWSDHRNDLLVNGFGILTSVGGSKLKWWVDPMGAIIISVIITVIWLRTAFSEFLLLVGVTAGVEIQQLITYVCLTHSPTIQGIDTVRVYHSGPRLIAEVDVVMNPEASLRDTHDVAEELQIKLESLPDVERAYVHVDYETTHKPEHAYKKDL
ncbi:putative metal tolerance protein 3 [Venustampulla echinocandica]|uniref:Putative metal tolerance protein 3 n=1 Tax=Venustampulla echinocandica TaxID=2656787 RepID=A0A370TYP2_9HELO|nr:putative metal tolerance protein 3 [Venustampulla echinocandica]RDL40649.1 putative metal tolerance protein 3 [Venustampulla echinocandica]